MAAPTLSMTDIEDLAAWALDEHGLDRLGWRFAWDRAVRRAGCCKHTQRLITLSRPIFEIETNRDDVLDTILHEIAHALVGPEAGHSNTWKQTAVAVGARPERCHSLGTPTLPITGLCRCETPHHRVRMPPTNTTYRCRRCRSDITWTRLAT